MNTLPMVVEREPAPLPLLLSRPDESSPVATLTWKRGGKKPDKRGDLPPDRWILTGSPMAVLMARRIFSASISQSNDRVSWPAIGSTFEDLLMLQHRFPIAVTASARPVWDEFHEDLLRAHEMRSALPTAMPKGSGRFIGALMPFQIEGLAFMAASRKCLLADDMGLGKTPQALAFLDRIDEWPAVIVCQPHVQRHWEHKIGEFLAAEPARTGLPLGGLTWTTLRGLKPGRDVPKADIYLVHYLVLRGWDQWLKARNIRTVIFDEAQELRHPDTAKGFACRSVARGARNVVGLSGTPIYNRGIEIYNVMNTLNRGCLGPKVDFVDAWCSRENPEMVDNPSLLGEYLVDRRLMLRRRKVDVLTDLPEKRRAIEMIDADNETFAEFIREAKKTARSAFQAKDPFDRARMEAEAIAGARLATGIAKAPAVAMFLRGLLETGEPTLLFAHHHAVIDTVLEQLELFNPVCITGRQSLAAKADAQTKFVRGDTNLCIIGLRAATGLDGLQKRARCVVFAEFDWSPAIHSQAEDRAHRYGQRDSVLVYYLATDLGSDPFMLDALNVKQSQFVGLMRDREETEEERAAAREATKAHMARLLTMLRGA